VASSPSPPPDSIRAVTLRFHEIAEANHRILNPLTDEKLMLLGEICRLQQGQRQLDLACGKGEMLCRWAQTHGTAGVGVDISDVFLDAGRRRAAELRVADRVTYVAQDGARYARENTATFDVVSCIGATWIGGGLAGTLELLKQARRPDGLVLVGECYWITDPPVAALGALNMGRDDAVSLAATARRFEAAGLELVEMVLADGDTWDRYVASQWWTVSDWLRAHSDDPDAEAMRTFLADARSSHLAYGRTYLGWGVFVLR
jgi:SAM-dependent methyltransferase